jgi:CTP-dependent riboflavin kinase
MEGQSLQGLGNGKRYIPIRFVKYFDLRETRRPFLPKQERS